MKFLLPNRFKFIGLVITPSGLLLWVAMQLGYITKLLTAVFGKAESVAPYKFANAAVAIVSFFSFLLGIYFITFSKEKIEDEMVQRTRLDSFQYAALIQIIVTIIGFICFLFAGDPGESGMLLFLLILIFIFWLMFIGRFNYVLHIKFRQ